MLVVTYFFSRKKSTCKKKNERKKTIKKSESAAAAAANFDYTRILRSRSFTRLCEMAGRLLMMLLFAQAAFMARSDILAVPNANEQCKLVYNEDAIFCQV